MISMTVPRRHKSNESLRGVPTSQGGARRVLLTSSFLLQLNRSIAGFQVDRAGPFTDSAADVLLVDLAAHGDGPRGTDGPVAGGQADLSGEGGRGGEHDVAVTARHVGPQVRRAGVRTRDAGVAIAGAGGEVAGGDLPGLDPAGRCRQTSINKSVGPGQPTFQDSRDFPCVTTFRGGDSAGRTRNLAFQCLLCPRGGSRARTHDLRRAWTVLRVGRASPLALRSHSGPRKSVAHDFPMLRGPIPRIRKDV